MQKERRGASKNEGIPTEDGPIGTQGNTLSERLFQQPAQSSAHTKRDGYWFGNWQTGWGHRPTSQH